MGKRFLAVILVLLFTITAPFTAFSKEKDTLSDVKNAVEGVISFKCAQQNAQSFPELLNKLSEHAGTYSADWYYIAFAQYGLDCENQKSIDALKKKVDEFYSGDLASVKVTDMQRVALALSSCGVDITNVNGHNLLADATYNRAAVKPLNSQGINSVAYALILLDYHKYTVPDNALTTREKMIQLILKAELENGGFALFGKNADVDMTSIAVQALAPYKDRADVKPAIDKCVDILSTRQDLTGGYKSFSNEISCESTAQVVLCLSSIDIDPANDSRFIKDGNSVLDGLMVFNLSDGSFSHFKDGKSDNMATYQALCALVGAYRYLNDNKPFYNDKNNTKNTVVEIINQKSDASKNTKTKAKIKVKTKTDTNTDFNIETIDESVSDTKISNSKITKSSSSKLQDTAKPSTSSASQSTEEPTDKVEFVTKPTSTEATIQESSSVPVTDKEDNTKINNSAKENKSTEESKIPESKNTPLYINFAVYTLAYIALFIIKRRTR